MPRNKFTPVNSSDPKPKKESAGRGEENHTKSENREPSSRKNTEDKDDKRFSKKEFNRSNSSRKPFHGDRRRSGESRGEGGDRNRRFQSKERSFDKPYRGRREGDDRSRGEDRRDKPYKERRGSDNRPRTEHRRDKPYKERRDGDDQPRRDDRRDNRGYGDRDSRPQRRDRDDRRGGFKSNDRYTSSGNRDFKRKFNDRDDRSHDRRRFNEDGENNRDRGSEREGRNNSYQRRSHDRSGKNEYRDRKPKKFNKRDPWNEENEVSIKPKRVKRERVENPETRSKFGYKGSNKEFEKAGSNLQKGSDLLKTDIRLNRYISNSGLCSRREADTYILQGLVTVNGEKVTDLGTKVSRKDAVKVEGKRIMPEKPVYILLNKPKGYITTTNDPEGRKTVMDLIDLPGKERIYPVGRLDRNTTGVLLLTNDGEVSQKLTHPSFEIKKIYRARLNKKPTKEHMLAWVDGIELEDGYMAFQQIGFVDENDPTTLGLEIHSGRNRIVRRMFEHFNYDVEALDRVLLGEFDKIKLGRGKWRFLSEKEIRYIDRLKRTKPKPIDVDSIKPQSEDLDNIDFE